MITKKPGIIKTLIEANPTTARPIPADDMYLEIAEFFYDTIQGEGINLGRPAAFLRVQHCTQNCVWCDTQEVWRFGNPYTLNELLDIIEYSPLLERLMLGQHLILTGGSPVKQQDALIEFFDRFIDRYDFLPTIEIENECTIMPKPELVKLVSVWNNSPKLSHSGNLDILRYQPKILDYLSSLNNSWFKFVVAQDSDWDEIEKDFLTPGLIRRDQIILMPLGGTRAGLHTTRDKVVQIAIEQGVLYRSREHVELWDKKTGV